jgi:Dolichyl-phosphate-mannose-protein mannosyltransferase
MRRYLCESRALHLALLAVPFVIVVIAWGGLTRGFPVYQFGDEQIHYGIVHQFVLQWPRPLLWGYPAWSGPAVYWLLATLTMPFGGSLVATRLVVTTMSWGTCALSYVIFRDRLRARPTDALLLALALALSSFFFGQSFRVLTDNPTWLFVVAALERLLACVPDPRTGRLVAFAVLAAVATLMRQVAAWLFLPAILALLTSHLPPRKLVRALAILILGLLPLVALIIAWGGLLPREAGPPTPMPHQPLQYLLLSLAVLGYYGVLLVPVDEVRALPGTLGRRGGFIVAAAIALALAGLAAGALSGAVGKDPYTLGWLSFAGRLYPGPRHTSLLLWAFAPLGAATAAVIGCTRIRRPIDRVLAASLAAVLLTTVVGVSWYQRYVDFPILLLLACLAVTAGVRLRRIDRVRWIVVILVSLAWIVAIAKTA